MVGDMPDYIDKGTHAKIPWFSGSVVQSILTYWFSDSVAHRPLVH
jgi:hypothetical protein